MKTINKNLFGILLLTTALFSCQKNEVTSAEADQAETLTFRPAKAIESAALPGSNFRVVGYMPSWAGAISDIQFTKLTHINYAFILPNANGTLGGVSASRLNSLVSAAHAAGVKVSVAIGGWNNGDDSAFETLSQSSSARTTFVNACVNLTNTYNLDGIDIDWEYPNSNTAASFTTLMQQLSTALHNNGKILTAAVVANNGGTIQTAAFGSVDFLNLMAYDGGQPNHSTYSYAVNSISYWQGRGLSVAKTTLGVPFYGRSSTSYVDYKDLLTQGANPNADTFGSVGYNGIPTMRSKTDLSFDQAGGIMIWDLNADAIGANSLLSAIHARLLERINPPASTPPYGTIISLKGVNGKYVTTKNGAAGMICTDLTVENPEKFTVIDAGGGKVALRSQGKYVSSSNVQLLVCTTTTVGATEKFDWVVNASGQVALKGSNGKFVSSENGTKEMTCTRDTADAWEYFTLTTY